MIIKSILDTDLYKFTTSYAYMKLFPQARGTFEFIDRDNTEYPEDFIERLYLELGSLGMLHLTKDEQEYMNNNCRFIPPVYWEWLSSFKFNSGKIQASLDENGHLHIKVTIINTVNMKFEYKMLERVYPVSESELDALGSLGWELVGMVSHEYSKRVDIAISTKISRLIYTFKRELK